MGAGRAMLTRGNWACDTLRFAAGVFTRTLRVGARLCVKHGRIPLK